MQFRIYRARLRELDKLAGASDPSAISAALIKQSKNARNLIMQWVDLGQALARIEPTDWLYGFELVCGCLEPPLFDSAFRYDDDFPEIDLIFNRNYPLARKDLKCDDDLGSARHVTKKACADLAKRMQAVALAEREAYVREEWRALMRAVSDGARHRDGLLCFCFAD